MITMKQLNGNFYNIYSFKNTHTHTHTQTYIHM
ncbi:hypothetical protein [Helicoverpa armigera SNPV]|uniref:Uncharacterized protein n=1 Tax=Helicoverpa SNPV AC53 TaxID=1569367 RepID=A0A173DWH1_9ABAC|nr:hypothetical protein [Helicoverpa SNPV AC53]ANG60841.1 hypothetical protein [Helicoverpa armigera SNPV]WIV86504.1 hypothetical protein [Helicoverpa SNPV AC53]